MNISHKQENGIVKLILRDTHDVLVNKINFDFRYSSAVKLQKLFFLLAEELGIPLTRSWYRHGGYVHNELINFKNVKNFPRVFSTSDTEIKIAEQLMREQCPHYIDSIEELIQKIFFKQFDKVLNYVYGFAPEKYKPMYYTNLAIEKEFDLVKNYEHDGKQAWQYSLVNFVPDDDKIRFYDYTRFSKKISKLILEIGNRDDFSCLYNTTNIFAEILDDYLIKSGFLGKKALDHLKTIKSGYETIVWNPIALKISENTVIGSNAEFIRQKQMLRFYEAGSKIGQKITFLKNNLNEKDMIPSLEERKQFFKSVYGDDKDFFGAVSNVWKSYKDN